MKKILTPLMICLALMAASCSSDDGPTAPIDPTVTYTGDVKTLMDNHCLACHLDPPVNGAPISLTTFDEVMDAVQNKGLITRIGSGTMPPGNLPKLTEAQVQLVRDWQAGNFHE